MLSCHGTNALATQITGSCLVTMFWFLLGACSSPASGSTAAEASVRQSLPTYTQYGWTGGAANSSTATATFFPITGVELSGNDVTLSYAWKDGVLQGTLSGTEIVGTWTQSNGNGPMGLEFDGTGEFVSGWWASADDPNTRHAAFLTK
jgi:hypothetical protein